MKRIKNALFSVLNVLVIVGILVFIMAGLMKIGIFEVPGFLHGFFGITDEKEDEDTPEDTDFLKQPDKEQNHTVHTVELNTETVKQLLYNLDMADEYAHDVQYTVFSDSGNLAKRVFVMKQSEDYCAFYLSGDGVVEKQILADASTTTVNIVENGEIQSISYANGYVDFAEQTGVILTHKDFFDAVGQSGYSFELATDDMGTVMLIEFVSEMEGYSQRQRYTLNLDYGIVTEASCYENDKLIYELVTNSLTESAVPNFVIPPLFEQQLPDAFGEIITEG